VRELYTRIVLLSEFDIMFIKGNDEFSIPISRPAAPVSQYGARSPEKAVTKYTPPVSGTEAAKVLISLADLIKPMESRSLT
jgi:hypothetical protein